MLQVNRTQFESIKAHFAKLKSELNKDKLAEFEANVQFFYESAPYAPSGDLVTKAEWSQLAKEVSMVRRATTIRAGVTDQYSRYKANAALGGVDGHPDRKSTYADVMEWRRSHPELFRELANGLGGLTKHQLKGELPS